MKARRLEGKSSDVPVWGKLVWGLGGEVEMTDLKISLEHCYQQVMIMQQAVQMSVLDLIAQIFVYSTLIFRFSRAASR